MLEAMRLPITPATTFLRELRDEVRQHYRGGRVIIAVDGIDGAGKTVFADALAEVFAEDGSAVFRASIDDFHRPRVERYARGRRSPEGFYRDSFDYSTFRRVLIDPFREGGQTGATTGFQLAAFDLERDTPVEARVDDGAAGCRAHRRWSVPAPPRTAGPVELVGLARRTRRCRVPAHGAARRVRPESVGAVERALPRRAGAVPQGGPAAHRGST